MKTWSVAIAISALVCAAIACVVLSTADLGTAEPGVPSSAELEGGVRELSEPADTQEPRLPAESKAAPVTVPSDAEDPLALRFDKVEKEIVELRRAIENLVPAAQVVEIEYEDPMSFEHADRYFEDGKFSTAAGVYEKFLEHHPQHPDALDILRKARDAYRKAGYGARAVDVQNRLLDEYQVEDPVAELMTLADLEWSIKRYEDAIAHGERAAELAIDAHQKLVAMAYRAWYIELGRGPEAGLAANREVAQWAQERGLTEYKVFKNVQQHVERLEKVIASGSR